MAENFTDLVTYLSSKLDADYLMIAAVDDPLSPVTANTLFVYSNGEYLDNFQYDLKNTPCENVVDSGSCVYPENVQNQFPDDALLADMDIISYGGAPLHDKEGKVNGVLAALYKGAIRYPESVKDTLDTFSHWASAELNRADIETKLKESEERFRTAFQLGPDVVVISKVDDATVVDVNETFTENLGYSRDEVIGKSALDLGIWGNPEKRDELVDLIRKEGSAENIEGRFRRKDKTLASALASFKIVKFNNQPCLLTMVKDITVQKEAEEALKKSEARYRYLYENAPVMLHSIYENGQLVSVSDKWLDVMGYDREEVIGRKSVEFLTEESKRKAEKIIPEFLSTGKV